MNKNYIQFEGAIIGAVFLLTNDFLRFNEL